MDDKDPNQVMQDVQGFFREGQREALYNACENDRDRLLIKMLWKTGRRIGEIVRIKIEEIDFENANILWHIEKKSKKLKDKFGNYIIERDSDGKRHYKNQKIDLMKWKPVNKELLNDIKIYVEYMQLKNKDYLFGGYGVNGHLTRQYVFKIIRKLSEKINLNFVGTKHPHPHHFRHSFAIDKARKLKSPADMRKLQQYMEHSDMSITEQYLQFGDEDQRSLVEDD